MADKYIKKNEVNIYVDDDLLVHNLEEVEGTTVSVGPSDAGKIPALNLAGKLDSSLLPEVVCYEDEVVCYEDEIVTY